MGMKTVRITLSNQAGESRTVLGHGDKRQSPGEIAELVASEARNVLPDIGSGDLRVDEYSLINGSETTDGETVSEEFYVNDHPEESYCSRNYGYQFNRRNHPKAEGPVGPTRLD
ncbi:MAG: hypothetical protein ABEK50_14260 [bacterium]